jgi:hypothetical protein
MNAQDNQDSNDQQQRSEEDLPVSEEGRSCKRRNYRYEIGSIQSR